MYTTLLAALVGASLITAAPIKGVACKRYKESILEPYAEYQLRYVALDCRTQHNTTFFTDCCHPLRKGENLTEVRADYCVPNDTAIASASAHIAQMASSTAPLPTSTDSEGQSDGNAWQNPDDGAAAAYASEGGAAPTTSTAAQGATPTPAPTPSPSPPPSVDVQNHAAQDQDNQGAPDSSSEQGPTTTSSEQAPTTSSSAEQTPTTTSSEQPQETPTGDNNGDDSQGDNNNNQGNNRGGEVNSGGRGTFYAQTDGGITGACGDKHSDDELVVALSTHGPWYSNPNEKSPYCGRQVQIWASGKYAGQGNTITATVVDACPTCTHSGNDIDLSHGAWDAIGLSRDIGVLPIEWKFV